MASIEDRFWSKVDKSGECWLWTGASHGKDGYGAFKSPPGMSRLAHRVAWQLTHGSPPPEGLVLDHLCRVRRCVNPAHLEPIENLANLKRGNWKGYWTHCINGHEFTPENTYVNPRGTRECRICRREIDKRRRPRKGPRTHCMRGHEFTPENTIHKTGNNGKRECRTRRRNRQRRASA